MTMRYVTAPDSETAPVPEQSLAVGRLDRLEATRKAIVQLILERGIRSGEAMPPEHELMRLHDVGRNTLREAIKSLQAIGVLEIRHGSGTYVRGTTFEPLVDGLVLQAKLSLQHDAKDAAELVEVREALEVGLIPRVMSLISPDDLERLDAIVYAMMSDQGEDIEALDRSFHATLYKPLANRALSELLQVFWTVNLQVAVSLEPDPASAIETALDHKAILDGIRNGDESVAVEAMHCHFDGIRHLLDQMAPAVDQVDQVVGSAK